MFFVTYHGSKPTSGKSAAGKSQTTTFNNIFAYNQNGDLLSSTVLQPEKKKDLSELRGFYVSQNYLYVTNGGKKVNNILCFSGSGTSYTEVGVFASSETVSSIDHPFAMCQGPGHR